MSRPDAQPAIPPAPTLASLRWAAGPEPDTWVLTAGGREMGWVQRNPEPIPGSLFVWWGAGWDEIDGEPEEVNTATAEAARREIQSWCALRLPSGIEDRGEAEGREG